LSGHIKSHPCPILVEPISGDVAKTSPERASRTKGISVERDMRLVACCALCDYATPHSQRKSITCLPDPVQRWEWQDGRRLVYYNDVLVAFVPQFSCGEKPKAVDKKTQDNWGTALICTAGECGIMFPRFLDVSTESEAAAKYPKGVPI
jgi:hypothetical protein